MGVGSRGRGGECGLINPFRAIANRDADLTSVLLTHLNVHDPRSVCTFPVRLDIGKQIQCLVLPLKALVPKSKVCGICFCC